MRRLDLKVNHGLASEFVDLLLEHRQHAFVIRVHGRKDKNPPEGGESFSWSEPVPYRTGESPCLASCRERFADLA